MTARARSLLAYGGLLVVLFIASGAIGYVYRHAPAPDIVTVSLATATPPPGPRTIAGAVTSVDGARLVLATDTGPVTVALPAGVPVEELQRAAGDLAAGTPVNVGVQATRYGLVLTGIVAIEAPR